MNEQEIADTLNKFRGEEAYLLHFRPRIEWLIDNPFCQSLSKGIHKPGAKWERMTATADLASMLPDETGLYMFVWKPKLEFQFDGIPEREQIPWILYVGKAGKEDSNTATIKSRYAGEYSKYVGRDISCLWDEAEPKDRNELFARFLTLRPLEFWYLPMRDMPDILLLERQLIRILRPPLNKQHTALRVGKTNPVV